MEYACQCADGFCDLALTCTHYITILSESVNSPHYLIEQRLSLFSFISVRESDASTYKTRRTTMESRSNAGGIGGKGTVANCGLKAPTWRPKAMRFGRSGLNVVAAAG